jgi:hypothetical protein
MIVGTIEGGEIQEETLLDTSQDILAEFRGVCQDILPKEKKLYTVGIVD